MKKPHIIIFNPDQMRSDSLGLHGNAAAITPFIDAFARSEGVSFSNAFCQNPVCVPSRISFTTGLYTHVHGHRTMSYLLRENEKSIFKELKEQGYHVWMNARNDLIAGQVEGLLESHASEIYYGGNSKTPPGVKKSDANEMQKANYSMFKGQLDVDTTGVNYGPDDEDLDAAIAKILNHNGEEPLCLFLGLINPHPPYQVEEPYYSAIDRARLPERIKSESTSGKASMLELIRENQGLQNYAESDWDELRATYLGMCMKVDHMFEKLCDALKTAGIYDDSAIFFFSDHGDYTGDYGISEKAQNTFEDCLTKVPLLIKPPIWETIEPGIRDGLVELVDFYGTVIDYAHVHSDHTYFGRSLREMIANRTTFGKEYVFCEGGRLPEERHCDEFHANGINGTNPNSPYYPRHLAQTNDIAHGKATMIRSRNYKYICRLHGDDEFYDLKKDPLELKNVIDVIDYKEELMKHKEELMRWYLRTSDIVPFDYDMRFSPEMTWAKVKRYVPQEYEAEIKARISTGVNTFALLHECMNRFGKQN